MSTFWSINSAANRASGATASAAAVRSVEGKMMDLEGRCDRALLVCEALWTLLRDRLGLSEEELVTRVNEIDLTDGRLDGRVRKENAVSCPSCGRTIARRFAKCIYCGQSVVHDPFG